MVQILYTVTAIFVLGITVLTLNVKIHGSQERMMFSELAQEMTSVGAELLNEIGKADYDPNTIFGEVLPRASLSVESGWGSGLCAPDNKFSGCFVINDFHGKTATRSITRTHKNTTYTVDYNVTDLEVHYVTEAAPHTASPTQTYAKEVTLNISTPALVDASGDPIEIPMSRVYTYPNF